MNRILYILIIVVAFIGCETERWGDYYDAQSSVVSDETVWAVADKDTEISDFIALIEELKLENRLQGKENLTLFAPKNGTFDVSSMTEEEKLAFAKNHMVSSAIKLVNLTEETRFRSLNSKYIRLANTNGSFTVNETVNVDSKQSICKNGCLMKIDQAILPEPNLYDYILELGDEYSIIRDTLIANKEEIFDRENSLPVGMDELGNVIYDSVWVHTNNIFAYSGNFSDESKTFTTIVPTNEQFLDARQEVFDYLQSNLGKYPQRADTMMVQNWTFRAMAYEGMLDENDLPEKLESLKGEVWIPAKQGNFTGSTSKSNGKALSIDGYKIPRYKYMGIIKYWPAIWYNSLMTDQMHEDYFEFGEGVKTPPVGSKMTDPGRGGVAWVQINNETANKETLEDPSTRNVWMECLPVKEVESNGEKSLVVQNVVPGTYEVTFSLRDYKHPNVQIYVNGQPIAKPLGKDNTGFDWKNAPNDLSWDKVIGYYT
ncbi:fasciclin domain-containing protein, partial [Puteibacter caeruleilacunae]